MIFLLLGVSAAALALGLTPAVRALAHRFRALDEPGERRVHAAPVPRLGGVAVLAAGLGALGLASACGLDVYGELVSHGWSLGWLLAGVLSVVTAGIIDDVWSLGPAPKLAFQVLAGGMALAGGYGFSAITNPITGGYINLGALGGFATLLWVVGITNAFNLIDGLDGLAAGVAMIASTTLLSVSLAEGRTDAAVLSVVLVGALAGFLYYNFNPASIFLGDSGSLLLGYLLAVVSIQSLHKGATAVVILVPILALGFPIMDTVLTMLRRFLVAGFASIFRADREHIHHRLLTLGMTHRRAVLLLYAVCVGFSAMTFLAVTVRAAGDAIVVGLVAVASYVGIRKLGYGDRALAPRDRPPAVAPERTLPAADPPARLTASRRQ